MSVSKTKILVSPQFKNSVDSLKCVKILSAICSLKFFKKSAEMAELVDAHVSEACGAILGGSSPLLGTF